MLSLMLPQTQKQSLNVFLKREARFLSLLSCNYSSRRLKTSIISTNNQGLEIINKQLRLRMWQCKLKVHSNFQEREIVEHQVGGSQIDITLLLIILPLKLCLMLARLWDKEFKVLLCLRTVNMLNQNHRRNLKYQLYLGN